MAELLEAKASRLLLAHNNNSTTHVMFAAI